MNKLNMVLNDKDMERLAYLKERTGITQNTELIRLLIAVVAAEWSKNEDVKVING